MRGRLEQPSAQVKGEVSLLQSTQWL
jgi:hypothetical protein